MPREIRYHQAINQPGPTPAALAEAYNSARAAASAIPTWRLRRAERSWRRQSARLELDLEARIAWAAARAELLARGRRIPPDDTVRRRWPRHR